MTKSNFKLLFAIPLFVLFLMSCGSEKSESNDKDGKEYTSAYVCPMHCDGSGSDKAGKCPTCKMDYVANKENKDDGHNHDHDGHDHGDHEGHDHGSHEGHDHGSHEGHNH
jgi:hypothetical protein